MLCHPGTLGLWSFLQDQWGGGIVLPSGHTEVVLLPSKICWAVVGPPRLCTVLVALLPRHSKAGSAGIRHRWLYHLES